MFAELSALCMVYHMPNSADQGQKAKGGIGCD